MPAADSLRALTRLGFGARRDEADRLRDPREWALAQLEGAAPARPVPVGAEDAALQEGLRALRDANTARSGTPEARRDAQQQARRALTRVTIAEMSSALALRVTTERPFVERLIAFWSDHLCVSAQAKVLVGPMAGRYERDAIRPHVLGRFDEMVLASARHPAMLLYLDNAQSIGPNSSLVQRAKMARARGRGGEGVRNAAERGLNENYARELLELHTLGVDGGYTQQDVTELARLLTGWSVDGQTGNGLPRFVYAEARHERGRKTILGERYGDGEREGVRAIRALCAHPSTATFVATKLARHFIADEPPPAAVQRLASVFRETGGDLRAVSAALVTLPELWDAQHRKFRTPQDWLVASLRHLNAPGANEAMVGALRQLRQPLWSPPAPKGFGDLEREWADPDALLNRAELARTLARRLARGPQATRDEVALEIAGPRFQWR